MFEITRVDNLVTLSLEELCFDRLSFEFSRLPSPRFVFVMTEAKITGYISHIKYSDSINGVNSVSALALAEDEFLIIEDDCDLENKSHLDSLKRHSAKLLTDKENINIIVINNPSGICLGVILRTETDTYKDQIMLSKWLSLTMCGYSCLPNWCKYKGYSRVAVYSECTSNKNTSMVERPMPDTLIISELASDDDISATVISDSSSSPGNLPIIKPSQMDCDDFDIIIVPKLALKEKVQFLARPKTRITSLFQIINEIYEIEMIESSMVKTLTELRNRGVSILVYATAIVEKIRKRSEWEKYLIVNKIRKGKLFKPAKNFNRSGLDKRYSLEEWMEFSSTVKARSNLRKKDYYYAKSTEEKVVGCPSKYDHTFWVFGDSTIQNIIIPVETRTPSVLQKLCNDYLEKKYCVVDNSADAMGLSTMSNYISDMHNEIRAGDCVLVVRRHGAFSPYWFEILKRSGICYYDSAPDFQRPHSMGEVFINAHHMNDIGAGKNAELIFREMFQHPEEVNAAAFSPMFRKCLSGISILNEWYDPITQSKDFREYIDDLKSIRTDAVGRIGAIVMNCNPFTLGHRYLIEYAASRVEYLYIFAVEEDLSIFPFADRIELIKKGTSDIKNVKVLPSGNFIISTLTFPEYFTKGDKQEDVIDPSQDVDLFARHIASTLGITVRFAGEEPLDRVTLQYNQAMARILPQHDIEFEVIPRKEYGGEVISASRVRKLLLDKDFDEISRLVPDTTLEYLKNCQNP